MWSVWFCRIKLSDLVCLCCWTCKCVAVYSKAFQAWSLANTSFAIFHHFHRASKCISGTTTMLRIMANEVSEVSTARVPRLRFWFVELNVLFEYFRKFGVWRSGKLLFNLIVLQAASHLVMSIGLFLVNLLQKLKINAWISSRVVDNSQVSGRDFGLGDEVPVEDLKEEAGEVHRLAIAFLQWAIQFCHVFQCFSFVFWRRVSSYQVRASWESYILNVLSGFW